MTRPRGIGAVEALDALPTWADWVAAGVTSLGSVPVLAAVLTLRYWRRPTRPRAVGPAVLVAAYALAVASKAVFALPRPPAADWFVAADGFGFPSGHALAATVVWGYLAAAGHRWSRRRRVAGTAGLVAAVAMSRVVLGVHYLVDVVAGVAIGLVLLVGVLQGVRGSPRRAYVVAVGLAGLAAVLDGAATSWLVLGVAVGGLAAVTAGGVPSGTPDRRGFLFAVAAGAPLAALLVAGEVMAVPAIAAIPLGVLVGVGLIGIPWLPDRLLPAPDSSG